MTLKRAPKIQAKTKWLDARRTLLRHVKSEVRKRLGKEPPDVARMIQRYEKELERPWVLSSQEELVARIGSSNLVFGGDFHALAQAQRTHLRILRALDTKQSTILALECFEKSSQKWLDLYIDKKISLISLRKKVKWDEAWGFPWDHYRPLLELAQSRGFRLLAVNTKVSKSSEQDLLEREAKAAKQIVKAWSSEPSALVYVIFGDLHLASAHLPSAVKKELARNRKFNSSFKVRETTVHLNSEHIYFELAKRDLELSTEVVKFSDEKFCVLSTPPWVKWQSYLLFLDRGVTSKAEADSYEADPDENAADFDPTDQVALLIRLAATDLGLQSEFKKINDLAVYSEDDEMIWREVSQRTDQAHRKQAEELRRGAKAFFLPEGGVAYLPKPTINAAASLAGLYLHARYSKRKRPLWNFPGDIRAAIWTEAVSYFISKLINHSRRSETVSSLRSKMSDESQNVAALKLALDIRLNEILRLQGRRTTRTMKTRPRQKSSYLEASRILGGMLGERLYLAYRSRKLKRELLLKWLRKNPASKDFAVFYDVIIRQVASW